MDAPRAYGPEVVHALKIVWEVADRVCSPTPTSIPGATTVGLAAMAILMAVVVWWSKRHSAAR
ncbi:MAG: hypothetical protein V1724_08750 [Chloroflexota bacterium]